MSYADPPTIDESTINEGDRVRVHIPHPDDDPEVRDYQRDIAARYTTARDHIRYNRRRGIVISVRDSTTFRIEFDDPDGTLEENPPSIGFLPRDLILLDESGLDETGMLHPGILVDTYRSVSENADRIIREARDALQHSARKANGNPLMTQSVAIEMQTRLSDERIPHFDYDPREEFEDDEIVYHADAILQRKATEIVRNHEDWDYDKTHAVMIAKELKSRLSGGDE